MSSWHSGQVEDLLKQFESSPSGISEQQAQERLKENGFNQLAAQKKPNLLLRVLVQMKDPMILVLLAAAALSFWASGGEEWLDAAIILMIVCVNQVISISQEDKAQQALEALKNLSAPQATVVRGGTTYKIPAAELVTGDIIHLEAGDYVPADARILQCSRLQADESSMTGESVPVEKFSDAVVDEEIGYVFIISTIGIFAKSNVFIIHISQPFLLLFLGLDFIPHILYNSFSIKTIPKRRKK